MAIAAADIPILSRLLDEALTLDVHEQASWLAALPAAHRHHAPALSAMLAALSRPGSDDRLATLPKLADAAAGDGGGLGAGGQVGAYRLIREIGRGGMGSVWLAERSDGVLKRQVALKLPHPGLGTRGFAERLERERDILASLAHPNIARLYDAGFTPEGQPYLALAYVQGQTLLAHCDAGRLGLRARIALFQQVLDAVQYAHAHLVIHRDIKPSNVMVDDQGQVQLLDFGIAKLVIDGGAVASDLTIDSGFALTPDYASPEQVAGRPISTASDVYSLGVLLYELLAGVRPYRLGVGSRLALEQAILATDPARPSTVVTDAAVADRRHTDVRTLAKALRGDLDTIVLKAMQKSSTDRYPSALALREDLQRHLDGDAVTAQPDRAWYRVRKFVGRHRVPVGLAGAAMAALLVGGGAAAWQAHQAAAERDRALVLLSRNQAVNEFLDMFITEAAQSERPLTVGALLDRSEALASEAFRQSPEHQALVLSIVGMHQFGQGDGPKADALLKRAVEAARASTDASFKAKLGCDQAAIAELLGRGDEARRGLLAIANRPDIDAETAAGCLHFLSWVATRALDGPAAVANEQRALEKLRASKRVSPYLEASYLGELGFALSLSGRNAEAGVEFAKSLTLWAQVGRESSPDASTVRSNWAVMNFSSGDPRAALALIDQNLASIARTGAGEPPVFLLHNRAAALRGIGRFDEAAQAYRTALAAAERSAATDQAGLCLLGLATIALEHGDLDEAQRLIRQAEGLGAVAQANGAFVMVGRLMRGRMALAQGQLQEARDEFTAAIGDRPPRVSTVIGLTRRAEVGLRENRLDDALQDVEHAVALAEKLQGGKADSADAGLAWLIKGRALAQRGDAAAAHAAYLTAQRHLAHTVDASQPALQQVNALLSDTTPTTKRPM